MAEAITNLYKGAKFELTAIKEGFIMMLIW